MNPLRRFLQRIAGSGPSDAAWLEPSAWSTIHRANVSDYTLTGQTVRLKGWESHPVVQACTRAIVDVVGAVPLEVVQTKGDELDVLPNHPLDALLANPMPQAPNMTGARFMGLTALHYLLYGNAFWHIVRQGTSGRGRAIALKLVHPEYVRSAEYSEDEDRIIWYDWTSPETGVPRRSMADDMCHFADLNAQSWLFGFPRGAAALADIMADHEATRYVRQIVTNDGGATQIFHMQDGATREQAQAAEARWREKRLDRGERGLAFFLPGTIKSESIGFNLQQLEFPDLRRVSREDICAAFQVDPRMVGIASAGNDGGLSGVQFREARRRLISQAVTPLMFAIEGVVNHWLAPEYGTVTVRFSPDGLSELTEDDGETSQRAIAEYQAGVRTLEEARTLVALPADRDPTDHIKAGMFGELTVGDVTLLAMPTTQAALNPPAADADAGNEPDTGDTGEGDEAPEDRAARALVRALLPAVRAWDESQHPRDPKGSETGGRFTEKINSDELQPDVMEMPWGEETQAIYSEVCDTTNDYTATQRKAVRAYTGGAYHRINEPLRDGLDLSGEPADQAAALDSAVRDWDSPLTVLRGVSVYCHSIPGEPFPMDEDFILKNVTEVLEERGITAGAVHDLGANFQSSSLFYAPALSATNIKPSGFTLPPRAGAVFRIRGVRRGIPAGRYSQYDDEAEIILPRNQRVRIDKVSIEEIEHPMATVKRVIIDATTI